MPVQFVWTIAAALFVAALTATLKVADYARLLKRADEELATLRKEMNAQQDAKNQLISENQEAQAKLKNRIAQLEQQIESHNRRPFNLPPLGCA
jgi:sensor histidine kinase YesM